MSNDIWGAEYHYPDSPESNYWQPYPSKEDSEKAACNEIQDFISSEFDLPNCDQKRLDLAKEINDYIAAKNYHKAIDRWNDFHMDYDDVFWVSIETREMGCAQPDVFVRPASFFVAPKDDEDDTCPADCPGCNDLNCNAKKPFVATVPGAVCRSCNTSNEYAYATNPNGTYLCRGCKIMHGVFGD